MTFAKAHLSGRTPSKSDTLAVMLTFIKRTGRFWIALLVILGSPYAFAAGQNAAKKPAETTIDTGIEHIHIVKPGESLSSIVRSYFGDNEQLKIIARFNQIENINQIRVGQEIKIPVVRTTRTDRLEEIELNTAKPSAAADSGRINESGLKNEKPLSGTRSFRRMNMLLFIFVVILLLAALIYLLKKFAALQDAPVKRDREESKYFIKLVKEAEPSDMKRG